MRAKSQGAAPIGALRHQPQRDVPENGARRDYALVGRGDICYFRCLSSHVRTVANSRYSVKVFVPAPPAIRPTPCRTDRGSGSSPCNSSGSPPLTIASYRFNISVTRWVRMCRAYRILARAEPEWERLRQPAGFRKSSSHMTRRVRGADLNP